MSSEKFRRVSKAVLSVAEFCTDTLRHYHKTTSFRAPAYYWLTPIYSVITSQLSDM